jgi:glycerol-3-phosphate dehydrogenase
VSQEHTSDTATISRDHTLHISNSGLVTITGGKWTTYRKMAEETIDHASILADLEPRETVTRDLNIHGYHSNPGKSNDLKVYGSDRIAIEKLLRENPSYAEKLHSKLSIYSGEVIWAVRYEMARTLEDFLFRRTRAILIDAISSIEIAPKVAGLMAKELGRDISWQKKQIKKYIKLAQTYIPKSVS